MVSGNKKSKYQSKQNKNGQEDIDYLHEMGESVEL